MSKAISLIIPAAGIGKRFGAATPKQYQQLLDKTILEQTLERFSQRADIHTIIIAIAAEDTWIKQLALPEKVVLVEGGAERVDSVRNALTVLAATLKEHDLVAVHDAARPCVRQSFLSRLFQVAQSEAAGVIPVLMAKETIKQVENGRVVATLNRDAIGAAQTPQIFSFGLLQQALNQHQVFTDEASAVEALGLQPLALEGDSDNIKITVAQDLKLAERALVEILREEQ